MEVNVKEDTVEITSKFGTDKYEIKDSIEFNDDRDDYFHETIATAFGLWRNFNPPQKKWVMHTPKTYVLHEGTVYEVFLGDENTPVAIEDEEVPDSLENAYLYFYEASEEIEDYNWTEKYDMKREATEVENNSDYQPLVRIR